ncbi:MAG TPA: DUF1598 domain-containing protein [Pirellulaceae bacterium]|nr:DUF1598 domain-containing protein [Pirellulaceae bacterium]
MASRVVRLGASRCVALAAVVSLAAASLSFAGHGGRIAAVGGVSIDPSGVVEIADVKLKKDARDAALKEYKPAPAELNAPAELRKISLRAIEEAVAKAGKDHAYELPDEIRFLAGIQRIQYVLVYPEQNDIVIAGPGEGWKLDDAGNYIGVTTGRPVLRLEDLIVALRTVENARQGGISVSIDPTAEGRQAFEKFMATQRTFNPGVLGGIEKALGQQDIKITGVPNTSNFARVLVAADFRMKRLAMNLDPTPLKELPSFLNLLKQGGKLDNMMPRWWLACNYEPLAKSEDGLAWELRGPGVKVMTEDEIIGADGSVKGTGKTNPVAQKWSDLMTQNYDALSAKEPVFGELRNLMDLCVISALISKEGMLEKAGLELPTILGENSKLELASNYAPKSIGTQCSFVKRDREYLITASGGVDIASWEVASKAVTEPSVGEIRQKAAPKTGGMWWN